MEKTVYITEEEREKCRRVIDAFEELYEIEDEDILLIDAGRYGFVKLQCYTPSYGFEELDTYTHSQRKNSRNLSGEKTILQKRRVSLCKMSFVERKRSM